MPMLFGFWHGLKKLMGKNKFIWTNLAPRIAGMTGLQENQVRSVLVATARSIIYDLSKGKPVFFLSIGKFYLQHRKARKSRDPYRKKTIEIGERYVAKFQYAKRAKKFIREEATRNLIGNGDKE